MEDSIKKVEVNQVTLGSTQSSPRRGDDCSGELDRLVAPFGSSLLATFSTGGNTWIAPTDKGSVVEEPGDKDEEDEGEEEEEDEGEV